MEHEFDLNEPLIYGVHCPYCGGGLLRVGERRAYCDWCDRYVRPQSDMGPDDRKVKKAQSRGY